MGNAKNLKIGIIGCGTIGAEIAKAIDKRFKNEGRLVAVADVDKKKAVSLTKLLVRKPKILPINQLIEKSDLVIEAASARISGKIARAAIREKKDVMIMSVGGIVKNYNALFNLARRNGRRVYLPSGAICGVDGVKAAVLGGVNRVELITRKPPAGFYGAPFIEKNKIDLTDIRRETCIFEGSALEAIAGFPANVNVSCVLS
ncbi:MAG: saccharopine dehydrogenase NADP-binding domain-containing protein, partial [Candidatus Omnitrophica bacterium]|nr:saccharopine dehydrogenase NADP-binding domain-containing protein [Candidatus Omnitrophota bacterium]